MYLAIDFGATKTLVACISPEGKIVESAKFPTPHSSYADFITALEKEIENLTHKDFLACTISAPGRIDRSIGVVLGYSNLSWINTPLRADVKAIVGCPTFLENDTKLAALSEAILLKGKFSKVLYITISTGISSGLVDNGKLVPELIDSESGRMMLEHEGTVEEWQSFASGKAIIEKYGKLASEITDPSAWKDIAHNIALGMINLIAVVQPDVIVVGGGVGTHLDKFEAPLRKELKSYASPLVPIPTIRRAAHPEEAVIYGCYQLAKEAHESTPK